MLSGPARMFYVTAFCFVLFCFIKSQALVDSGFWLLFYFIFFSILKIVLTNFLWNALGTQKVCSIFVIEKFVFQRMQEIGTIQISCVLQYEKGPFFSGVSCGSITGEKLQRKERIGYRDTWNCMFYFKRINLSSSMTLWLPSHPATKEGKEVGLGEGKEKENTETPTFPCISQEGRLMWTGMTDTTVTVITNQDATEPPNTTLYVLSYYLHIYSLVVQRGEEFWWWSYYLCFTEGKWLVCGLTANRWLSGQGSGLLTLSLSWEDFLSKVVSWMGRLRNGRSGMTIDLNITKPGLNVEKALMKRQPVS